MGCRNDYLMGWDNSNEENQRKFGVNLCDISLLEKICCELCREVERSNLYMSDLAKKWWKNHKSEDRKYKKKTEKLELRQQAEREASEFLNKRIKELGA